MITRNLILIPKLNNLLLHSDFQEHHLVANKTLRLVAWVVSGKALLQRVSESRVSLLSQTLEEKAQSAIMNWHAESGITGVMNELLFPFDVTLILH